MRARIVNFIWGLILVAAGALFLAQNLGWIGPIPDQWWKFILAGLSLTFFAAYFVNGLKSWGWLFPAFICAGAALTVALGEAGTEGGIVAAPVLIGVALPFLAAFLLNRRENWWALIPAWALAVVTAIVLFSERVPGEFIATLVLLGIALPFLVVYLTDRSRWWALIPAGILAAVAAIVLVSAQVNSDLVGGVIVFIVAVPFFIVYFWSSKNWWALIPAGILTSVAVGILLSGAGFLKNSPVALMNGVVSLGIAATFGALWLRRATAPTDWAKYPAIILALIALLGFVLGVNFQYLWPVLLVAAGVLILLVGLRPKKG
jgi:hypothetical protein